MTGGKLLTLNKSIRRSFALTSGGQEEIRVRDFDAFLLVGMQLTSSILWRIYISHRMEQPVRATDHILSEDCLRQALYDFLQSSAALRIAASIRSISDVPLILLPSPLPSARIARSDGSKGNGKRWALLADAWNRGDIRKDLLRIYNDGLRQIGEAAGFPIVVQPAATIDREFTAERFAVGSLRLPGECSRPHDDSDVTHMNAAYGTLILQHVLPMFQMSGRAGRAPIRRREARQASPRGAP